MSGSRTAEGCCVPQYGQKRAPSSSVRSHEAQFMGGHSIITCGSKSGQRPRRSPQAYLCYAAIVRTSSFSFVVLLAIALATSAVGCPCVRGTVNASESLRWWAFSNFGAQAMCPEMLKRGVPLKLSAMGQSSVGRFFPQTCSAQIQNESKTIVLLMGGTGYAYVPVAKRVGFFAGLQMEFAPDFRMEEDSLYVWGRFRRMLSAPNLQLIGVENSLVSLATMTPIGDLATTLGQSLVQSEIARGFTVIHQDDGDEFSTGIIMPPQHPPRPFKPGKGNVSLESDTVEVHSASRAYLGPFHVTSSGSALYLKVRNQGTNLFFAVVDRTTGEAWRAPYEKGEQLAAPPGPVFLQGDVPVGETSRALPLKQGSYYLVLENRATSLGSLIPLPIGDTVSYATYGIELGDAP